MELHELLEFSVKQKASDLHLSPTQPPLMRLDGELVPIEGAPLLDPERCKQLIYGVMSSEQQKEFETALELDFGTSLPNVAGFRVNAFYQRLGVAAVFRVIPDVVPTLEQLDLPPV